MFFNIKKETKIEIFFWLVVLFVFSPRILLEVYEHKLKNALTPFENNDWTVKDKDGNVIYEKLTLPYDLRWKEQKTDRREWVFEKQFSTQNLNKIENLAIVLGRAGDVDYVEFNHCDIGSTAFNLENKKPYGWAWSHLRVYYVPQSCITYPTSIVKYHIFKIYGPGYGAYSGPFGVGKWAEIQNLSKMIEFFKYTILSVFGLGLIFFIGIQYLFVYFSSENRENYGTFALLSVCVGIYLFMTSTYPFILSNSVATCMRILFGSAFLAVIFFLTFFKKKFNITSQLNLYIYYFFGLILFLLGFFQKEVDKIYKFYEMWHPLFLISFTICFFQIKKSSNKKRISLYDEKYIFSFLIFLICCFHDVVVSIFAYSNSYLIGYAFTFFVLVVGLTLSREYADAFLKIEDLVIERTNQLNHALFEVKEVQKLKDDQARRFAHDIRSPLAALQVLKDVASHELSPDAKSLFKHTIVRINDLANTALPKLIGSNAKSKSISAVFLWPILDKLVSEKRLEYGHLQDLNIEFKNQSPVFDLHCACEEVELTRLLSNLINNAIEARNPDQPIQIEVSICKKENWIVMIIRDFGKGMPEAVLAKVFEENFTYGKKGGSGVGLKHAKTMVEAWGGILKMISVEKKGTTIEITIPASEKPDWLLTSLDIRQKNNLVIIDDQPFVVDAWKQKLQTLENPPHIFWVQNMEAWQSSEAARLDKDQTLYLVDQDLSSSVSGLDMIKTHKLGPAVALVTGNDDDLSLRKRAQDIGIAILPKSLIHEITIIA